MQANEQTEDQKLPAKRHPSRKLPRAQDIFSAENTNEGGQVKKPENPSSAQPSNTYSMLTRMLSLIPSFSLARISETVAVATQTSIETPSQEKLEEELELTKEEKIEKYFPKYANKIDDKLSKENKIKFAIEAAKFLGRYRHEEILLKKLKEHLKSSPDYLKNLAIISYAAAEIILSSKNLVSLLSNKDIASILYAHREPIFMLNNNRAYADNKRMTVRGTDEVITNLLSSSGHTFKSLCEDHEAKAILEKSGIFKKLLAPREHENEKQEEKEEVSDNTSPAQLL